MLKHGHIRNQHTQISEKKTKKKLLSICLFITKIYDSNLKLI